MKLFMRLFFVILLFCISLSALAYFFWYKPRFSKYAADKTFSVKKDETSKALMERMQLQVVPVIKYAKAHGCNTNYCFLVDMKVASGKKRFFVYNLQKDSVELSGLVTHGSGKNNTGETRFSNTAGSLCTSLGKYKVGGSYAGKFGLAYKLYGLDTTNSNALNRFVVLHSHSCVPNEETAPFSICESWGCPTVAPAFLGELRKYIDKSARPLLLSVYY